MEAPDPFNVKVLPTQMLPLLTVNTGRLKTLTVATAVLLAKQPCKLLPVME